MPTYQYACTTSECGNKFDLVQSFTDPSATECPVCAGPVRKVFSAVGVVFKGSGFYRTDSRAASAASEGAGKSSDSSSGSSDAGAKSDSGSKSGSAAKSDTGSKSDSSSTSSSTSSPSTSSPSSGAPASTGKAAASA